MIRSFLIPKPMSSSWPLPLQAVRLDRPDGILHRDQVGLIVVWLHIQHNR